MNSKRRLGHRIFGERPLLTAAVLLSMFTGRWWFPTVFEAIPIPVWMAILCVGAVFGVWRWVAYFADKGRS